MRLRESIALWAYVTAMNVLLPLGILVALPLLLLKEKRRKTLFQRLGFQRFPCTRGRVRPIWVHALSLGEMLSCTTLMQELRKQVHDRPIYFSVSTLSAMQMARERIRPLVDGLFYFPLDLWCPARRALKHVNPALMVFIETDIWPGFQHQLRVSDTPALLVNGRLSPDTHRACIRFRSLFAPALNTFRMIYPQSTAEGQRYRAVGVDEERLGSVGNLKFDVADAAPARTELQALSKQLGLNSDDRVLLAGSTHAGEEGMVLDAFRMVRERIANARLIIVPRHPARGGEVVALAAPHALPVHQFTLGQPTDHWDVMIVDAMGVLSKLYHLAEVSFVGGSLVPKGGQNPLESAAAGCPVIFGPDMSDFPDIATWLVENNAAIQIRDGRMLGEHWLELLSQENQRDAMTSAGRRVVEEHRGATQTIAREIMDLIR